MASKRWTSAAEAEASFGDSELGLAVFRRVDALIGQCGGAELRVAATQVSWARRRGFVYLWSPKRILGRGADVVLSVALPFREASPRWKETVEVRRGLFMHHLEVNAVEDVNAEVADWIATGYAAAG